MTVRSELRRRRLATPLVGILIFTGGCSSPPLPSLSAALAQSAAYIDQILAVQSQPPIATLGFREIACTETDDSHGHLLTWYDVPDKAPSSEYMAQANQMIGIFKKAGLGTATLGGSLANGDLSVNVMDGSYSIGVDFPDNNSTLTYGVDTCYSTPPPSSFPAMGETTPVPQPTPSGTEH